HQGAADPTTEGWAPVVAAGGGATAGPVSDDAGDAWRVTEKPSIQGGFIAYQQTPDDAQLRQAIANGWALSARVRVPEAGQTPDTVTAFFQDGSRNWQMEIGSNAAGDPIVTLPTLPGQAPVSYTVQGAGETYNEYDLV